MTAERLAIWLMTAQGGLFAAETLIIHHLGSGVSVMQVALIRSAAGVVLAFALARSFGFAVLRTRQLPMQMARGGVSLLYLWVMVYSYAHLPLADATALSYTQIAYIAFFSVLILREQVSPWQWTATAIGIFGTLLIAKPSFADWNAAYLIALAGASLNGLSFVLNRYLQREDTQGTTMFYSNIVPLFANLPVLATAPIPAIETFLWLPGLLLLGPLGMYAGIVAARHADASVLGPYTLLRLVIAVVIGVAIFREMPDILGALGATLILVSCALGSDFRALRSVPVNSRARGTASTNRC